GARARELFDRCMERAHANPRLEWIIVPNLQLALARRVSTQARSNGLAVEDGASLALWHPAAEFSAATERTGDVPPLWVEQEAQLAHLGGPQDEYLFFKFPLTGTFEFQVESDHLRGNGGGVGYAGLVGETSGNSQALFWPVGLHANYRVS